jgi:radical SAM superfamily enzyme YgiQ (UPF0313 family)
MWADAALGQLKPRYVGTPRSLAGLPTPRYDLLPKSFFIPRVVQATRGCPFACSFCSVPELNPGFRARPVEEVLRDLRYDAFDRAWQRKVVWFWDDNLTADRHYATELLEAMVPLNRWWLTQASMDIAQDPALLDLMSASGCIGVFFGIETFGAESLKAAHKPQNQIARYRQAITALHQRGIAVMAGFVAGFDGDHFNGYNVAFTPRRMSAEALLQAHRTLWRRAFAPRAVVRRIARAARYLRPGALLMATAMNGFYGLKRLRGNLPRCATGDEIRRQPR